MSGLAKISRPLKELRIHFCQVSKGSQGLRNFVINNYKQIKQANPNLPILVREAEGVEARVFARYDKGQETKLILENIPEDQVPSKINSLL
ncbi:NADH dehydrogenase, alpha subcomplex, subunit 2 [Conidiobolus coronatus NRRL 28638]|uniref:NADH dehydrogenase, alpha subcomplex, subunit 2 n=1 Tax=Conidiobolus coronatus (strain ATCC 28846 / CBS 209.66 / NRRL 28638) TaxID=796925 RepID=A0A137P2R3_CONC2|nr:NADH dehydrogenase, alpha subcomplex, subunit 2 [Conidiobolus coronatus NRRL 28638]|eukprot:KXN69312.1 NADH dehydrogenase, alpha subcomplex, subunit 2 [Conidiobolus coronatus NRRL 28638]